MQNLWEFFCDFYQSKVLIIQAVNLLNFIVIQFLNCLILIWSRESAKSAIIKNTAYIQNSIYV